jgi:hypothetical protein
VIRDDPIFSEANRASDCNALASTDATRAERVVRFVFSAIGDFVIERTEFLFAVAVCFARKVVGGIAKDFNERMRSGSHSGEV